MKSILLTFLTIAFLNSSAQKRFSTISYNILDNGSYIKVNVASILDFGLPTIQPGFEYKFGERSGIEGAVGIPLGFIGKRKTDSTFFHFYKIRTTLKYYSKRRDRYFAFECFYTHAYYSRYNDQYYLGQNSPKYFSDYTVSKKRIFGFDIKGGKNFLLGNKLFLETFTGIGIRFVTIKLPVNINPQVSNSRSYSFQFLDVVGSKVTPHLTFGLQFVYKLESKKKKL